MSVARHTVFARGPLRGEVSVPGDKSISHRALMFAAAASGTTTIFGSNRGADVLTTRDAVAALGAHVDDDGETFVVRSATLHDADATIDARNSGTTARLMMGLCAGLGLHARFDGDDSLRRRPMERIARPLRAMGAHVDTTDGRLPVEVRGIREPRGGTFALELPSAQLKSAILLAQLRASADVTVTGDLYSRDHTERMLRHFGRAVEFDGKRVVLHPGALRPADVFVPADLSAAAFFLVAAAVTPKSEVVVRDVGINPTRSGILDVLKAMGTNVTVENARLQGQEPVADLRARSSRLQATDVNGELIVRAIDEVPLVAIAAAFAEGVTRIRDATDLRTKESDRLAALAELLRACGIDVRELPDGLDIAGGVPVPPQSTLHSHDDHRIAMAAATLAAAAGPIAIDDAACVAISFPGFSSAWARAQEGLSAT